jgi:hypothetical protein
MERSIILAFLLAPVVCFCAEPVARVTSKSPLSKSTNPSAWLGLQLVKPDETITAQLPMLPPGIGFLVKSMDPGGPAETAGLCGLDLIWKFNDQMLVNESQLATLLRLSRPEQEVTVSIFRGGKPLIVKLKLGQAPVLTQPFSKEMAEAAIMPGDYNGPMRVVNIAERSATYACDEGRAVLQRERDTYHIHIYGSDGNSIYSSTFSANDSLEKLPEDWRRRVFALRRGLDQSLGGNMILIGQPRPRVIPTIPYNP